jgi:ABC-type phosphate/phosphonate transport system substrate-binding protein
MAQLQGRVRLVATPVYRHPGCEGVLNGSFVIVRADAAALSVAELRGQVAAINDRGSNSGMNLLRHTVAPHALEGRFFGQVVESGSHRASIAMVARGEADVAAVDCVTFGNLARFAPELVAGVRVLAETAKTPGLPLITRTGASDAEVALLRSALTDFAADPAAARVRDVLGLDGFVVLPESAYDAVTALEREAAALFASVARTVKFEVPRAMGTPGSAPMVLNVKPVGSAPRVTVKSYGATPPSARSVTEYPKPRVAGGRERGSMVKAAGSTVSW